MCQLVIIMWGKWSLSCLLMLFQRQLRTFELFAQVRWELEKQLGHHFITGAQDFTVSSRDSWHRVVTSQKKDGELYGCLLVLLLLLRWMEAIALMNNGN